MSAAAAAAAAPWHAGSQQAGLVEGLQLGQLLALGQQCTLGAVVPADVVGPALYRQGNAVGGGVTVVGLGSQGGGERARSSNGGLEVVWLQAGPLPGGAGGRGRSRFGGISSWGKGPGSTEPLSLPLLRPQTGGGLLDRKGWSQYSGRGGASGPVLLPGGGVRDTMCSRWVGLDEAGGEGWGQMVQTG